MKNISKRRGITLIETIITMAIAAIVMGGVWTVAATAFNNQKKGELIKQTTIVLQNIHKIYGATQLNLTGLTLANAVNDGIFPADMIVATGESPIVRDKFGDTISISYIPTPQPSIQLKFSSISDTVCVALVSAFAKSINSQRDLIQAGFSSIKAPSGQLSFPITPATIAQGCATANITQNAALEFVILLI